MWTVVKINSVEKRGFVSIMVGLQFIDKITGGAEGTKG
jgi:hypothetical protein